MASQPDPRNPLPYPAGPLDRNSTATVIGGTHNVSVKIDPARAVRGGYTPIPGDAMPAGTPTGGGDGSGDPYCPEN